MTQKIKAIAPTAGADEARAAMRTAGVRHLLVVDGAQVVGILSDRDFGKPAASRDVGHLMTTTVVTAAPKTTIRQAANLLRGHVIGCLVVMDGKKPAGIVTTTDLLELIGRGVERPIERSTRWTLRARGNQQAEPAARHARR